MKRFKVLKVFGCLGVWAQTPTNINKMEVKKMVVLCNYLVYRELEALGVLIFVAGFRDKGSAEEYIDLLKSKYPQDKYCVKEVKEVERLRDS